MFSGLRTLARYEEDIKLLGQARGSVLQQQQAEQQQKQQQFQVQLQQALQAERNHWSSRLQAANDEWRRKLEDERRLSDAKIQQAQHLRVHGSLSICTAEVMSMHIACDLDFLSV